MGRSAAALLACLVACGGRTDLDASGTISEMADATSGAEPNADAASANDGSDAAGAELTDTSNAGPSIDDAINADAGTDPCTAMGGFCTDGRAQHDCAEEIFVLCGGDAGPMIATFCCTGPVAHR